MLKITNVEITDFGRHRHVKKSVSGHVVGLTGPNGFGKSTVLQAIQFALTGTIDHEDALCKFIREEDCEKPPKKASVKLHFEADGKQGVITRSITPTTTSRELVWEGCLDEKGKQRTLSADKAVSEVLFQILGVDKKAINSTVFIRQGAIDDMFGKDTARRDFYARLLMLGHLDKIADVTETFRKQIGGSLEDLTPAKDAAERNYQTAAEFFNETDSELQQSHDWNAENSAATALHAAFVEQAAAELDLQNAKVTSSAILGDGTDAAAKIQELDLASIEADNEASKIAKDRQVWSAGAMQMSQLQVSISRDRATLENMNRLQETQAELQAHEAQLAGGNPSARRGELEQVIRHRDRLAQIPPLLEEANTNAAATLAERDSKAAECDRLAEEWRQVNSELSVVTKELSMRQSLQKELAANVSGACDCPVCGSTSANLDFLQSSIARFSVQKDELIRKADEIKNQGSAARSASTLAERAHASWVTCVENLKKEQLTLKLTLQDAPDTQSAQAQIEALEAQIAAYNVAAAAVTRLRSVVNQIQAVLPAQLPTAAGLAEAEQRLNQLEISVGVWDASLDTKETELRSRAGHLRMQSSNLSNALAVLQEGKQRMARAEANLQQTLAKISQFPPIYDLLSQTAVVTIDDAVQVCNFVRERQSAHSSLVGKHEAARKAMLNADAALNELELRIAEQGNRRRLLEDLTRLRDAFRPAGVTMDYLDYKFGQIAEVAADYLAESKADFMVAASPDAPLSYEFIRLKPGEKWLTQSRLSGGQRIRLAVATLRAIHSLIMPNVGLIVLDEPTTHLDTEAKLAMADMLRRIGAEGTLQMIVCDHDPLLIDAFDSQIVLEE